MKVYASGGTNYVVPAADSRLTTVWTGPPYAPSTCTWINPQSFQIFSPGLDGTYSAPTASGQPLQFPSGGNYQNNTFDDITNFSNGRLREQQAVMTGDVVRPR